MLGQLQHAVSAVSQRVHAKWTTFLMQSDLADPHRFYVVGDQRRRYPGRATFLVATLPPSDFAAALAAAGPDQPRASEWCGTLLAITPPHACGADCAAAARGERCEACLRRLLDTAGGDGHTVVGCLALKPYLPPDEVAAIKAKAGDAAAVAAAGDGMHEPPDHPAVLAALNRSATAELERMVVHPALRRCGAASLLLGQAEAWCAAHGYKRLVLSTLASMKPGLALYQRRGFSWMPGWPADGIEHDSDGDKIHICWLEKDLEKKA